MPISRTFSEELVLEWMTLSGYLVELGVPVPEKGRSGLNEVDAVGVRMDGETLVILHAEVGAWPGYADVKAKFAPTIAATVESHIRGILQYRGPINYVKLYIAVYLPKNFDKTQISGIEVWDFQAEFIRRRVRSAVERWRRENVRSSGHEPHLPESMWLLKTLDFA